MSHDGSSAKSYIRHATEKERLDNLAFASFPEDYLPYAAAPGHHRVAAPPPYLLWGEDNRRRRPTTRRRKPRCAGALLCAIALVVVAILAVVAISVYLGVVTNLFRSPVASVSGRFLSPEEFSEALLNSSSAQFLEKAEFFKSKVEKAFLSSPLEPAFIAARIYSFRPGLVVFFRVYLDRRKLQEDGGESAPLEQIRKLVSQKLTEDPESVHVEENEELLAVEHRAPEKLPTLTSSTTKKPVIDPQNLRPQPPRSGGVGEWRPVPIEDSVKPSFADRPIGGGGSANPPEESVRRNPVDNFGPVRVPEDNSQRNPALSGNSRAGVGSVRVTEDYPQRNPPLPGNSREGFGSVRVVEESPLRPPLSGNIAAGIGSVKVVEDSSPRNPVLSNSWEGAGSVRVAEEQSLRNSQSVNRQEGTGSVRLLDKPPTELLGNSPVVGTVRVLEDTPAKASNIPVSLEGVGSVRLLEETPKKKEQLPTDSRVGIGSVRGLEESPGRKPPLFGRPSEGSGSVRVLEEPPTLAPFVSLIIRNRSRSDKPRNTTAKLERGQQNADLPKIQHTGVASIREIITEVDSFPLSPLREIPAVASRLLDLGPRGTTESKHSEELITEVVTKSEILEDDRTMSPQSYESVATTLSIQDDKEPLLLSKSDDLELINQDFTQTDHSDELKSTSVHSEILRATETATEPTVLDALRLSSLESILFSHPTTNSLETTLYAKKDTSLPVETSSESISSDYEFSATNETEIPESIASLAMSTSPHLPENSVTETTIAPTEISGADDSHTIVNPSMYPISEPHYHTIEREQNTTSSEPFEMHTQEGHGFHKPLNNTSATTHFTVPNSNISSTNASLVPQSNSSGEDSQQNPSEVVTIVSEQDDSQMVTETLEFIEHSLINEASEASLNTSVTNEQIWSDEDEVTNATTEDNSQPKVVPQLQSDLISNDIEDESGDEEDERFGDEILRHITTVSPHQNGSGVASVPESSCPPGSVPCDVDGCGVRCDMRKDCPNNEDERDCSCSDLLRTMGQSQKVCDGVDDCSDGSDETDCPWCPSTDHFRCPGSRTCISLDRVCDGREDCPTGHDERRCVTLADSSADADSFEYRQQGYLIVRRHGRWGKLCLDSLGRSRDHARRTKELGRAVCSALTYRNMSSSVRSLDESESENSYYQISATSVNNRSSSASSLFEPSPCEGREVLKVQCQSLECGLRPSVSPTQRRRIVGGRSATGAGAWPWAAALYREGDFQCGAALINDRWLVSAAHCFYSSQGAYWTARLGVLRRGSELPSNGEQVRRIQNIILHPQYEDIGFINDIALLKIDRPVPFSDALRPICLPTSLAEDASLWHGRSCSVVGWGKLYEIGHTFPDSLQEVQLPVISSAECQRRSLFLPAYRITPNMFCAGYERGGRDACLGDSGGPMACQRPADGRWLLLGVTSNGDGCGRPNRPGVYTQVASYLPWIRNTTSQEKASTGRTGSESTCSGGVRCRLGRCISRTRVCDGRRDCAGGEDENSC